MNNKLPKIKGNLMDAIPNFQYPDPNQPTDVNEITKSLDEKEGYDGGAERSTK